MKTKLKSLAVIIVMLITTGAMAQQGNRERPTVEKRTQNVLTKIEKKIEIDESQKAIIEEAFNVFFTSADNEMNNKERPDKSVMDSLEKERDNKIKEVLSEDQYKSYLKISAQLRPRQQQGQGQRPQR
jgi:hypothetical protein